MTTLDKNLKLNSKWTLWYHHQKDNWKLEGYRKIFTIETINDYWSLFKNLHIIGGISKLQYFFMREDVTPLWEDPKNRYGGCWSIKITKDLEFSVGYTLVLVNAQQVLYQLSYQYHIFNRFSAKS